VEEEVEGMGEEDLEEHRVVEESIESARREEEEVHHMVEYLFQSLSEDLVQAWLRAKNKGMKATSSLQIPVSSFNDAIREVWMSAEARRKCRLGSSGSGLDVGLHQPFCRRGGSARQCRRIKQLWLWLRWGRPSARQCRRI
jgi:hypothetical protein